MNVVVLVGRLTDNPELRHTNSNISVTRFSIAVDRAYRSGEERQVISSTSLLGVRLLSLLRDILLKVNVSALKVRFV